MSQKADRQKMKEILINTIISLCKNGMSFCEELTVEGLIAVTLDKSEICLINIHERVAHRETEVPTPVVTDVYPRTLTSGTVAEKRSRPRHKLSASQHQQSNTQSLAVQPFFAERAGGHDDTLLTMSTGCTEMTEWHNEAAPNFKFEPGEMRSSRSTTSGPVCVKREPDAEQYGYDEMSSEVYYGSDANAQESHQYDAASGESYYAQSYGDNSAVGQFPSDMYAQESVPPKMKKAPQAKRRKVNNPAAGRPTPSPAGKGKDSSVGGANNGLIERALNLVQEGHLTAGVAIKLFGIPKSTFYKKLSDFNLALQQQNQSDNAFHDGETTAVGGEYFDGEVNEWDDERGAF